MPPKEHTQRIDLPHASCILHTEKLYAMSDKLDEIHRRLFIDNGEPCLQSKVRRLDGIVNALIFVVCAVVVAVIGVVVKAVMM